jgi:hypothetical protein
MATKPQAQAQAKPAAAPQPQVPAQPAAPAAAPAAQKVGAAVVLPNGQRRIDYIREQFAAGRKRGEIAKELGVAYQIVFAATKEKKAAEAPAPAAQ